jgi:HAD superfamily hydrolase (TIGR01450 family)
LLLDLNRYKAIFFDVDGVLRRGSVAVEGAAQALTKLRARGIKVGVITNNSGSSAVDIAQSLSELGVNFYPNEVVSAVNVAATWIARQGNLESKKTAFVLGSKSVEDELASHGIVLVADPSEMSYKCDYLVVGVCRHIDYKLLTMALRVALQGAHFLAINTDRTFPGVDGLYPAAGASVGALIGMLGRQPDTIIGKPSPLLGLMALEMFGVTADETLLVGDTLFTDVDMGRAVERDTVLVLTGNNQLCDITPENAPTYTLASVADLA